MKVAFLDRDGVINEEVNYLHKVRDFKYTYKCISALKIIQCIGYEIIIVTNQAGIAKGIFTETEYKILTSWLVRDLYSKGINVKDIFYCPHHPEGKISGYSIKCKCRKPSPGMILRAKDKYNLDLQDSLLVGDKSSDVEAAIRAGLGKYYLVESGHPIADNASYDKNIVKRDLYDVATSLKAESRKGSS